MKKYILLTTIMFFSIMPVGFCGENSNYENTLSIIYPDNINPVKFFDIKIKINDENIRKNANLVASGYGDCYFAEGGNVNYDGSDEVTLKLYVYGDFDYYDSQKSEIECSIKFMANEEYSSYLDSVQFVTKVSPIKVNFSPGSNLIAYDKKAQLTSWDSEDRSDEDYSISIRDWPYGQESIYDHVNVNYKDAANLFFNLDENDEFEVKTISAGGANAGYYFVNPGIWGDYDPYLEEGETLDDHNLTVTTALSAIFFYDAFVIEVRLDKERDVPYTTADAALAEDESELKGIASSLSLSASGSNSVGGSFSETKDDDLVLMCDSDSDCESGYGCSACSECHPKDDLYDEDEVELSGSLIPEISSKAISNRISNIIMIRHSIDFDIENDKGESLSICNMKKGSFDNVKIEAEILSDDRYAGFTGGHLLDKRKAKDDWPINLYDNEFEDKSSSYFFIISPNDRKKK